MLFIYLFMFMSGLFMFCINNNHLLINLLTLEYLVLLVFMLMYFNLLMFGMELYFMIIFLIFSVCEGALGLGILVNMIRSHGNDYLSSFSLLSW
uniref:NADH-ubiquinone oxidoreductase chain 4L n=1 Tax=Opistholeptus burmanus TaxID=2813440 RepID=A0A8T9ZWL3_9HEMI|nr:NADH dehydrogenase subunit 4L [Opistholeptus burmanus]